MAATHYWYLFKEIKKGGKWYLRTIWGGKTFKTRYEGACKMFGSKSEAEDYLSSPPQSADLAEYKIGTGFFY